MATTATGHDATTATVRTSAVEDAARRHDLDRLAVELGHLLLERATRPATLSTLRTARCVPSIARGGRFELRCSLRAAARFHYPHRYCRLSVPIMDPTYASLPLALIIRTGYCGLSAPLLQIIRTNYGPNACIPTTSTPELCEQRRRECSPCACRRPPPSGSPGVPLRVPIENTVEYPWSTPVSTVEYPVEYPSSSTVPCPCRGPPPSGSGSTWGRRLK
jgi:hypothetical protein